MCNPHFTDRKTTKILKIMKMKLKMKMKMKQTSKGFALDRGIELITPPEAARLAGSAGDSASNEGPIPGAELAHEPTQYGVLLERPWALHFISALHHYCYFLLLVHFHLSLSLSLHSTTYLT